MLYNPGSDMTRPHIAAIWTGPWLELDIRPYSR